MKISCVMSTYGKHPRLIEESIECFLRQTGSWTRELVIVNDFHQQTLYCDNPLVRIINLTEKIIPLSRKFDYAMNHASGDLLLVWDDDDIFLPNRFETTIRYIKNGVFHTNRGLFEESPQKIRFVQNLFHSTLAISREVWIESGGYGETDATNIDSRFLERLQEKGQTIYMPIEDSDVFYIYRWGSTLSYHTSLLDSQNVSDHARRYTAQAVQQGEIPTGAIELIPHWKHDYIKWVRN